MIGVHLCPVCRQPIQPTTRGNIGVHLDTLRADTCPGGGHPFAIAITVTPEFAVVSA